MSKKERERWKEARKQQKIETAVHKQEEVIFTKGVLRFKGKHKSSARLKAALRFQQSYSYMCTMGIQYNGPFSQTLILYIFHFSLAG